jgi:Ser/Thr protein kinase RdoA (MazF antagonist)
MTAGALAAFASDDTTRTLLERALAERFGCQRRIARLLRRPWDYSSSFMMEAVDIGLEDGTELSLVAKDLSPRGKLPGAAAVKPEFLYDPAREIEAYRRILWPAHVGAPAYFGAALDRAAGQYLLFIEHVNGVPLWQIGEFEVWVEAARWLARFHARAHELAPAAQSARLLRYDRAFLAVWPQRAALCLESSPTSRRASAALQLLLEQYDCVIDRLLALPTAILHGEFMPSNIIVRPEQLHTGSRICPVDWELCAVGPALMDLSDLTAGAWTSDQKSQLANTYLQTLSSNPFGGSAQFEQALDLCRLHRAVQWLGWAADWNPPAEHATDWLREASLLARRIVH